MGLKSLIKVERIGTLVGKPCHQVSYYITSGVRSAVDFAQGIRRRWAIENRRLWVLDMVFDEDRSTIRMGNAPANLSIVQALAKLLRRRSLPVG
ncbi:ISAs1 family transposase [Chlorogloeopsis sp. ULAP01]|uniref:ISAs1 family transposase n=1 Tax=Chlorogloeopsis sp. ULAP01 TaxID=3056483 RepID=UPI0025AA8952|nr:ISAs1 family transposase [Chlorogloeopsis sp. ULAP01]MDM9384665.1 ISAs1 family transposase [Chlorogloeopsis sp. ULAP01]